MSRRPRRSCLRTGHWVELCLGVIASATDRADKRRIGLAGRAYLQIEAAIVVVNSATPPPGILLIFVIFIVVIILVVVLRGDCTVVDQFVNRFLLDSD